MRLTLSIRCDCITALAISADRESVASRLDNLSLAIFSFSPSSFSISWMHVTMEKGAFMARFNECLNREPFPGAGRPWTYILSINMNVTVIYRKRHLFDHVNTKTSNHYIVPLSRSCECTHNAKFPVLGHVFIAMYVSLCFRPFCSYDYKWACTDLAMGRQGSQDPRPTSK